MKLHRHLGISWNMAWRMRRKLMQVMMERDREHPLSGRIELDDARPGGERSQDKCGRGAPGRTPFLAAVATNEGCTASWSSIIEGAVVTTPAGPARSFTARWHRAEAMSRSENAGSTPPDLEAACVPCDCTLSFSSSNRPIFIVHTERNRVADRRQAPGHRRQDGSVPAE